MNMPYIMAVGGQRTERNLENEFNYFKFAHRRLSYPVVYRASTKGTVVVVRPRM